MKNTLSDLNNILFEQLERVNDDSLTKDQLEAQLRKTDAIVKVSEKIMPNRGSWNGRWSGENDTHIIIKTDRQIGKKRIEELDGRHFYYRWDDGWTACVSARIVDRGEAAGLRKRNRGFCGYDWMVRSIIADDEIKYHECYG